MSQKAPLFVKESIKYTYATNASSDGVIVSVGAKSIATALASSSADLSASPIEVEELRPK